MGQRDLIPQGTDLSCARYFCKLSFRSSDSSCAILKTPEAEQKSSYTNSSRIVIMSSVSNVCVCCAGLKVVGFAMYYFTYDPWVGKQLYLEDFYVMDAYRGMNI